VSYDNVVGLADDELVTLEAVVQARATVDAERDPLVTVGLLGSDTTVPLAEASAAYGAGRLGDARAEAAEAVALIDGADELGAQRVAAASGVLVLLIVLAAGVLVVRRRRRHPAPVPTSASTLGAAAHGPAAAPGPVVSSSVEPAERPATLAAPTDASAWDGSGAATTEPSTAEDEEGT
jgi:hypothetical protein